MRIKKSYLFIAFIIEILGGILLSSCATKEQAPQSPSEYFMYQNQTILKNLQNEDVSVMRLGDTVTIIIPSRILFQGYSVQISSSGKTILEEIVKLIEPMNKVKITVSAYAEAMTQSKKDLMMTQWQAETVSNYFWESHINARMIYAIGYGGGHPVQYAPNTVVNDIVGDHENYRVEITLKDYVS